MGTSIFLPKDKEFPSEIVVTKCIGAELAAEVKKYRGEGMPYSLLMKVSTDGRPPVLMRTCMPVYSTCYS